MRHYCSLVRHEGNEQLFQAIEMSVVSTLKGMPLHIHAEGLRGTGKTTILRSARSILPSIRRVKGCLYNCDPTNPHCPDHRGLDEMALAEIGVEEIPMPFLEISPSAKIGTAVGSLDLSRITNRNHPDAALLPGTIPQAHRGILFVDEINRLAETAPEIADVLLGVMGTKPGVIKVEETGLPPVSLPMNVSVWAASNPDEDPGPLEDIRRQLSDRFDMGIGAQRPSDAGLVLDILRADSKTSPGQLSKKTQDLMRSVTLLDEVYMPWEIRQSIAGLYVEFQMESLRAVEALQVGSCLAAALEGSREVNLEHLVQVVPMVLRHRVDLGSLEKIVERLANPSEPGQEVAGMKPGQQGVRGKVPEKEKARPAGSFHRMMSEIKNKIFPGNEEAGTQGKTGGASSGWEGAGRFGSGTGEPFPLTCPPLLACPIVQMNTDEVLRGEEEMGHR